MYTEVTKLSRLIIRLISISIRFNAYYMYLRLLFTLRINFLLNVRTSAANSFYLLYAFPTCFQILLIQPVVSCCTKVCHDNYSNIHIRESLYAIFCCFQVKRISIIPIVRLFRRLKLVPQMLSFINYFHT